MRSSTFNDLHWRGYWESTSTQLVGVVAILGLRCVDLLKRWAWQSEFFEEESVAHVCYFPLIPRRSSFNYSYRNKTFE
jgi:hypothetical protein